MRCDTIRPIATGYTVVCHQQLQRFTRHTLRLMLFVIAAQPASAKPQSIYRCPQLNAPPLFSGTPCPSAQALEPKEINGYVPPTLTRAEQQQLQNQRQRLSQHPDQRKVAQQSSSKELRAAATAACKRHQEALRALQSRRRKGYKLSEAPRLDHQEQGLRQDIRLHC